VPRSAESARTTITRESFAENVTPPSESPARDLGPVDPDVEAA
jgi:hypothetical protein